MDNIRKIKYSSLFLVFVFILGTFLYTNLLGWNILDSFYMTVITITTIGFKEVHPLNETGKFITIFLIFTGLGGFLYGLTAFGEFLMEGHLRDFFRSNLMDKKVKKFSNHIIICGFGRMGKVIADELVSYKQQFVVIEREENKVRELVERNYPFIEGDATDDIVLKKAGIDKARAILCVMDNDAENLFVTLSARQLNKNIFILARCSKEASESKLYRAGADKVVFPYKIGAKQMAQFILRPGLMQFFEMAFSEDDFKLHINEFKLPEGSFLENVKLKDSKLREKYNIMVVAIRRLGMDVLINPPGDFRLKSGDILIVTGESENMQKLLKDLTIE